MKWLVNGGINLDNTRAGEGEIPLILAAKFGCVEMVRYMLQKGAQINVRSSNLHPRPGWPHRLGFRSWHGARIDPAISSRS